MGSSAVTAGVLFLSAVLREMVPTLTLQTSDWFSLGSFYVASPVANREAVCDRSVGRLRIVEGEEEMGRSLVGRSSIYGFGPFDCCDV